MVGFLWAMVVVMAVALVVEVAALAGMGLVALGAARRMSAMQEEVAQSVRPTIQLWEALKVSLKPNGAVLLREGEQIKVLVTSRFCALKTVWEDARRRGQRLRFRLGSDGVQTVEQVQQGVQAIRQGVAAPVRAAAHVARLARSVNAAFWLLRKVA